jgi:NADH-quinone oxidoreductase subunit M
MLGALATLVLAVGIYPRPLTDAIDASSTTLLGQIAESKQPSGDEGAPARSAIVQNRGPKTGASQAPT